MTINQIDVLKKLTGINGLSGSVKDENDQTILLANRASGATPLSPAERDTLIELVADLLNEAKQKVEIPGEPKNFISAHDYTLLVDKIAKYYHDGVRQLNDHKCDALDILNSWAKETATEIKSIKVEVRGGVAYCDHPDVEIIDYDDRDKTDPNP